MPTLSNNDRVRRRVQRERRRFARQVFGRMLLIGNTLLFASAPAAAQATAHIPVTVTLITGDRVITSGTDSRVDIEPGSGRERIGFITERAAVTPGEPPHLFVIPEDAIPLLAANRVDRRLFDVLLFEQHPDWTATEVKAALMGTAAFNPPTASSIKELAASTSLRPSTRASCPARRV